MLKFIFALCFFFSQVTYGQQALKTKGLPSSTWNETLRMQAYGDHLTATGAKQYLIETGHKNLLVNESFEASTVGSGWTVGFSSPQIDTTVHMPPGKQSLGAPIFSGAGSQLYQAYADCSKLYGQSLEASIHTKSTATTGQVCSVINGTDYECITMDSSGVWKEHTLNFAAPSSGSCGIRVKSTGSAFVNTRFDDAYLGLARNIGTAAQATLYGGAQYPGNTNCTWLTTGGSFANFAADTDCTTATPINSGSAPSTKIPGVTFASLPPGDYMFVASDFSALVTGSTTSTTCGLRFHDGTTAFGYSNYYRNGTDVDGGVTNHRLISRKTYTTTQTNITIQIQGARFGGNGTCALAATTADIPLQVVVYRFPTAAEQVTRPNNSADLLGTIFYTPAATCPANSVKVDGSTLNATTHAALIAKRTADGIASPSVLENLSGLFIRSAGTQTQGGVAHTAGALRTYQADLFKSHTHTQDAHNHIYNLLWGGSYGSSGPGGNVQFGAGNNTNPSSYTSSTTATNQNTGGVETRPANMAFTPCMWFVSNPAPLIASSVTYSNTVRAEGVNGNNTIAGGTYTPSIVGTANTSAALPVACNWFRIADKVSISCYQGITCTTNGVVTNARMSLPVASNFTANTDLGGSVAPNGASGFSELGGLVYADIANDTAFLQFVCQVAGSNSNRGISFIYTVK